MIHFDFVEQKITKYKKLFHTFLLLCELYKVTKNKKKTFSPDIINQEFNDVRLYRKQILARKDCRTMISRRVGQSMYVYHLSDTPVCTSLC